MAASSKPRPTLLQAITLTGAGVLVGAFGLRGTVALMTGPADAPQLPALMALCVGALMFAVGFMLLLVAIFRPFFGKRHQDEGTESGGSR